MGVPSSLLSPLDGAQHLTPEEWDTHLCGAGEEVILLDTRNYYEVDVGAFMYSDHVTVDPRLRRFSQFPQWVDQNRNLLDGRKVYMYCTGGIRCERATAYVKHNTSAKEVYQLQGGIHQYLVDKGSHGHWRGKNFVFDNRLAVGPSALLGREEEKDDVISHCFFCGLSSACLQKCARPNCHVYIIVCPSCLALPPSEEGRVCEFFCCGPCGREGAGEGVSVRAADCFGRPQCFCDVAQNVRKLLRQ